MKKGINLLFCCLLFISCVNQPKTLGIDISHHNKITDCDWQYFKDINVKFVFIKASEGASYKDPDPDQRAGLIKGLGTAKNLVVPQGKVINGWHEFKQEQLEDQSHYHSKKRRAQ